MIPVTPLVCFFISKSLGVLPHRMKDRDGNGTRGAADKLYRIVLYQVNLVVGANPHVHKKLNTERGNLYSPKYKLYGIV